MVIPVELKVNACGPRFTCMNQNRAENTIANRPPMKKNIPFPGSMTFATASVNEIAPAINATKAIFFLTEVGLA